MNTCELCGAENVTIFTVDNKSGCRRCVPVLATADLHIYDWIEQPPTDDGERYAKGWFDKFTRPAAEKYSMDGGGLHLWLEDHKLFCTYEGRTYRVTGASRLGDVWLNEDINADHGYDLRVNVLGCSGWREAQCKELVD